MGMTFANTHANALGWLLDESLGSLSSVRCAVLISSDGLLHSRTADLPQDAAEKRAAMGSGLLGIAREYGAVSEGGGCRQVLMELEERLCLIGQAGTNMLLLVETTGPDADIAVIAGQMELLARRVGQHMRVADRLPSEHAPRQ
ncbi:roadblock/LC7 domain-containing protein [Streptomyces sp. HB132]|uniref:roadblock/LC7 domain-containing protein n=1 Tax=Streptomyces sp. HB132 TaxID=767388 RepID=UPI00195F96F5|nr:roadblock/LC7 domain-containing protein [Streptomyces sp. HB132]MBM7438723.1 putative regulator of Ras-like GTPase activity (Roadblock/LC7/MglB family) [Streptomyces sp. HB132]